jgi:hypothetical protein
MTAAELIAILKTVPPETPIMLILHDPAYPVYDGEVLCDSPVVSEYKIWTSYVGDKFPGSPLDIHAIADPNSWVVPPPLPLELVHERN